MISIFGIFILIMSVVIHEVSHGFMALALGDPTAKYQKRLTLNPINHLDLFGSIIIPLLGFLTGGFIIGWAKPVPFNPYNLRNQKWGEALVAVAGPLSNIFLALIFGLLIRFGSNLFFFNEVFINLASYVVLINISLALFNLMPIPPLDGSKILFSFLPYKWNLFLRNIEVYGMIIVFAFVFIFWGLISPVIGYMFTLITGIS